MIQSLLKLGLLGLLLSCTFLYLREEVEGEIDVHPFTLPDPPELAGPLAPNNLLQNVEYILKDEIGGPESLVVDKGIIYTTLNNGSIIKVIDGKIAQTMRLTNERNCGSFESEVRCGRPLGIRKLRAETFIVADAYLGVFLVDFAKKTTKLLVDPRVPIAGKRLSFLNDLDILNDDEIIFTDSSPRWTRQNFMSILLEHAPDGRVCKHKISTKETTLLLDGLHFPNGVQVTADKQDVLIAECGMARIVKLNLKTGQRTLFAENLPGMPDNIRTDDKGRTYVGLAATRYKGRESLLDRLGSHTSIRHFLVKVFNGKFWHSLLPYVTTQYGIVLEFDHTGKITRSFQDPSGTKISAVSQASRDGNYLYIGSFHDPYIAKMKIN